MSPPQPPPAPPPRPPEPGRPVLALWLRLALLLLGWLVVLIGVAGLALPGIQGVLTIVAGAAILSIASETVYRLLKRLLERWPRAWQRIDSFRSRMQQRLARRR